MFYKQRQKEPLNLLKTGALILFLFILTLLLLQGNRLHRINNVFYDYMLRVHQRPANEELLIVAIDEKSLRALGRWPWGRSVHADMLEKLTAANVSAVGIDILFPDQDLDDPEADQQLVRAIAANGRVALAVAPETGTDPGLATEILPAPELAVAAAKLAHIDFELEADGVSRRVFLHAGLGDPRWPILGLALLELVHPDLAQQFPTEPRDSSEWASGWVRVDPMLVAYSGPPGNIPQVSYIDVLHGRVPTAQLENRIVFVGATAVAMGDTLSTPMSSNQTAMPGIEANANVLASLLDKKILRDSSFESRLLFAMLMLLALIVWLRATPSRYAVWGYLVSLGLTLLLSLSFLWLGHLWVPPSAALVVLTALYVTWTWLDVGQFSQLSFELRQQVYSAEFRDRVTGLPNRLVLEEQLNEALPTDGNREPPQLDLVIIGIGRLQPIIDTVGTVGGEQMLQQIAERLSKVTYGVGEVFRLESTEFAVLYPRSESSRPVAKRAETLLEVLSRPYRVSTELFDLKPSIGISSCPEHSEDPESFINSAHTALSQARRDPLQPIHVFSQQMQSEATRSSRIRQDLRSSIFKGELSCLYQPQADIATRRLIGVETLVRWQHPTLGDISPANFIPIAEREALIDPIGRWVLEQACKQGQVWRSEKNIDLRIAVNVSAIQLNSPNLVQLVADALTVSGLPARRLELEITETAILADQASTRKMLKALKRLGLELAIDDFGTGYSSLTYLKEYPVDRVKIDQSFVSDVHTSSESAEITRSIVAMSKGLGLSVIAEGVEREEHLEILQQMGCDEAQGYLIGKPMTAAALETNISDGTLQLSRRSS